MDTIQIKLELNYIALTMEDFKRIETFINHIKSPDGHTFCDMIDIRDTRSVGIKISYPRFFYGSNVFLITTKEQCFQVQRWFCEAKIGRASCRERVFVLASCPSVRVSEK